MAAKSRVTLLLTAVAHVVLLNSGLIWKSPWHRLDRELGSASTLVNA